MTTNCMSNETHEFFLSALARWVKKFQLLNQFISVQVAGDGEIDGPYCFVAFGEDPPKVHLFIPEPTKDGDFFPVEEETLNALALEAALSVLLSPLHRVFPLPGGQEVALNLVDLCKRHFIHGEDVVGEAV